MSDPDWIGAAVRDVYWSADGRAIYYSAKRSGSPIVDLPSPVRAPEAGRSW